MGTTELCLITPEDFAVAMTRHWEERLGNVSSEPLRALWRTMCQTFNEAAQAYHDADPKWRILQPPTGSGKTQGLCVYAAMSITRRTAVPPLGILIVTRTIAQAEEIAKTVREVAQLCDDARQVLTKHSENKTTAEEMRAAAVLIITHSAYIRATEALQGSGYGRWEDYTTTETGPRRLTVIDEALSGVVNHCRITGDDVNRALGLIPLDIRRTFPHQVEALETIRDTISGIGGKLSETGQPPSTRFVWKAISEGRAAFPARYSMAPLIEAVRGQPFDQMLLRKESAADRKRAADKLEETLRDCEAILSLWAYYHREGREDTLHASRLRLPLDLPGPVVLDATASQNFHWRLMERRALVPEIPKNVRDYSTVTLHVARGRGLGKEKMGEEAKHRLPKLIVDLQGRLQSERKVLLCVHKRTEPQALQYEPGFSSYDVAHWGAIDGKNDWNEHDAVVIFGLPYLPQTWAFNCFFAFQGIRPSDWFNAPSWRQYHDVRRAMVEKQIAAAIVQALNRVRCRRVVDERGRCHPTDAFIVLPQGAEGDAILELIREEMPNIAVADWDFDLDGPKVLVRKGSAHAAVLSYMEQQRPGETSINALSKALSLSQSTKRNLLSTFRDPAHPLTQALAGMGVSYVVQGRGRASRTFLLKAGG